MAPAFFPWHLENSCFVFQCTLLTLAFPVFYVALVALGMKPPSCDFIKLFRSLGCKITSYCLCYPGTRENKVNPLSERYSRSSNLTVIGFCYLTIELEMVSTLVTLIRSCNRSMCKIINLKWQIFTVMILFFIVF